MSDRKNIKLRQESYELLKEKRRIWNVGRHDSPAVRWGWI